MVKDNYNTWAMQIEAVMVKNRTWKYVDGLSTALQVWERLKSEFASTSPVKKVGLLKHTSTYKICKGEDIHSQLMDFFDITAQLEGLEIANFDVFHGAIEAHDKLPRPEWLQEKILEEFNSQNQKNRGIASPKQCGSRKAKDKDNTFRYKCFRCHHYRHKASECLEKDACGKYAGEFSSKIAESVDDTFQVSERTETETLRVMRSTGQERWCLDSGCTSYMCNNNGLLIDKLKTVENGRLLLASDACISVEAKGVA
ncbi:hypothetical protein J437_LFUL015720 [Ladona fulva]|uniref:Uncharacterized protein n=1 Tax=Ladona fulva TaxID=123851 RepID=A0A8K0KJM0_LADFU|nr:hypothetical protein J437_LFUL015720 [Ladona fulva]